jgi:GTP-binding protein HflX
MLLVHLSDPKLGKSEMEKDITETWNLVATLKDSEIIDLIVQKGEPFKATYIGPGKAEEVIGYITDHQVDVILISGILTPVQKFNLTKMCWGISREIQVWDRVDLILTIFEKHAHTTEAKLQIDLARMRHMGPSIFGMGMVLSRQGGGIGTRGIGETNTELMKRHWKREIKRVTDELDKLTQHRQSQIDRRKNLGLKTVSIVGYTNAGKSTLFNLLTHKHNLVDNILFATLDSTVGELFLPKLGRQVVISDTIGFIKDLPPRLIEAFKSTLLESLNADIILHVTDLSDPDMYEKINVVDGILDQMGVIPDKIIVVFNKTDIAKIPDPEKIRSHISPYPGIFLSAKNHAGLDELIENISGKLTG